MKKAGPIIIAVLVGVTAVSIWQLVVAVKQRYDAESEVQLVKDQLMQIQQQRGELILQLNKSQENEKQLELQVADLQDTVKTKQQLVDDLESRMQQLTLSWEDVKAQLGVSRSENVALAEQVQSFKAQLAQVAQEKELMAVKLGSLAELKKAIKELKKKMRLERLSRFVRPVPVKRPIASPKTVPAIVDVPKTQAIQAIEGNQGYIIKDGQETYPGRVKIEVQPLPN